MIKVGIIDYGIGNVKSIENAIIKCEAEPVLTRNENVLLNCDKLILPGVGAFSQGMKNLLELKLDLTIYKFLETSKPLLGICLGMQLLFDESEEFGKTKGLGIFRGTVKKIKTNKRLPHIGWTEIKSTKENGWDNTILQNIGRNSKVYFVHSFAGNPDENDLLAYTQYENEQICAAIKKENIYGVQFHPEKSGVVGLDILNNFVRIK